LATKAAKNVQTRNSAQVSISMRLATRRGWPKNDLRGSANT